MDNEKPIKTGIKCPSCNWDDSREFNIGSVLITIFVCPSCAHLWEELKEKKI